MLAVLCDSSVVASWLFPVVILAPITISSSEVIFSRVVVSSFPLTERVGTPTVSWVASRVPFTNIAIDSPSKVEDKNVHSSVIVLVDSTVVHLIPSNTENLAVCSCRLLLIASVKEFSLLMTVNSGEPDE